ncbi:GNAT family N-acetyltransferase [Brevundimonas naejangsanensis]|uniref:GNAT family N-acetyltransferase n=1 Tax=Brevundimonas naejangsanensis TaxID=588932 RepID=UPI00106CBF77|nr:GNAT family protein [Brevundimonas naejangsanensis]QBQ47224.1 N-acetyltransferase [Brevundimonas naejangsanensis]
MAYMINDKLRLCSIAESDAPARFEALKTVDAIFGLLLPTPVSLENTIEWCRRVRNASDRRDFSLKLDGRPLSFGGLVNINAVDGRAEAYIFSAANLTGQGHGSALMKLLTSYAKHELNLRKITLYVTEGNDKAEKFYKSLGFYKEGTLSKHIWHKGLFRDRYVYSKFLTDLEISAQDLYRHFY